MTQLTEQRVVATKPKIGARPVPPAAPPEAPRAEAPAGRRRSRKGAVLVVLALLAAGAAYWFLLRPADEAEAPAAPQPGEVLVVDPISINLADGHYLRIGIGLQMVEGAEKPSTARALDLVVSVFSGRPMDEVTSPEGREALKAELRDQLVDAYEGEVMDVYLTDYVTQ